MQSHNPLPKALDLSNLAGEKQIASLEVLLHRMMNRIRQSLELSTILTGTVAEVRTFLGTDRVKVYRFHTDGSGEVVAESVQDQRLPSLLGQHFPADDIPPAARELFLKARQRSIVDVASQEIGLSPLDCPETGESIAANDIRFRPVDPCHVEYLTNMGVQSSLVVPILHRDQLWGLLVSHHSSPRQVTEQELQVVQLVADQVSIAITHSTLLSQTRARAQQEATINRVAKLLHSMTEMQLQQALEQTVSALEGVGGRVCIAPQNSGESAQLFTCGEQPIPLNSLNSKEGLVERHPCWQAWLDTQATVGKGDQAWAIADLYRAALPSDLALAFLFNQIRGLLIIRLQYRQQMLGYLSVFRHEIDIETLWLGRFDRDDPRHLRPRESFEKWWGDLKQGQAREWTPAEIELAQALGSHFAMAIHQYELYQQVHALNADLFRDIKERKQAQEELQRQHQRSQLFAEVTLKIRQSLQLEEILQTTVTEVQQFLQADRIFIYRLQADGSGKVVKEAVVPGWSALLGLDITDPCFQKAYLELYRQGRISAIADLDKADIHPCHVEMLQQFGVKANLVVPVLIKDEIWGLLVAHQCANPRQWTRFETELLRQLGDQIGIALAQAQLLEQEIRQRQELARSNTELEQRVLERTAELQHANAELLREISDRKQAKASLERLSRQNELILNSAGEGIYGLNSQGKTTFVNPAAARMLEYPVEELIDQFMHAILNHSQPDGAPYLLEENPIYATLKDGAVQHITDDIFWRRDGSSFPVEYVSTPIREQGTIVGAVVIFKDITERQIVERMKDEFVSVVSHEMRTPLTSIRSALGLLARGSLNTQPAKSQRMLEIAFDNTNRLVRLINDILDIERINSGKVTMEKQTCNAADLMTQSLDAMRAMAEKAEVRLCVTPVSAQLWADPDRIIQTLTNLLSNAIKFSPQNTTVWLTAELQASQIVLFQVKDQGRGIPNNNLETIFDRFQQVDASNSGHQGGTGLGLAICRSIVQQHGGTIWAESTLGEGSTFYFTLPISPGSSFADAGTRRSILE